jgi:hypothetical protein
MSVGLLGVLGPSLLEGRSVSGATSVNQRMVTVPAFWGTRIDLAAVR